MKRVKGLSEKEFLGLMSSKLKQVLNPTFYDGTESQTFLLTTDLDYIDYSEADLYIVLNGLGRNNTNSDNTGIIDFVSYYTLESGSSRIYGMNSGTSLISGLGVGESADGKVQIAVITNVASKLSAEIWLADGIDAEESVNNKNHCVEIDSYQDFNPEEWDMEYTFEGESAVNFNFNLVDKDGTYHTIDQSANGETYNSIEEAGSSDKLSSGITFKLKSSIDGGVDSEPVTLYGDEEGITEIETTLSDEAITAIAEAVQGEGIPVATDSVLGGINVAAQASDLDDEDKYPVQLYNTTDIYQNERNYAYVDLSELKNELKADAVADKHRYTSMQEASDEVPMYGIVEYIGDSTPDYTFGYFYQKIKLSLIGTLPVGSSWTFISVTSQQTLNEGISEYNRENNYPILPYNGLTISLSEESESDSDSIEDFDDTLFDISSGGVFIGVLTYAEIKSRFGIKLLDDAENYNVTIALEADENSTEWVQKNVQPPVNMQSALDYKGTVPTKADLEELTSTAQKGDFYTELENHQEWFFNGIVTSDWEDSWEYMGEILTIPEYTAGRGINISSSNVISAQDSLNEITLDDHNYYHAIARYSNGKYHMIHLTDSGEGNTFYISVITSGVTDGPREIIYRIDTVSAVNLSIQLYSGDTGTIEAYSTITNIDNPTEIIFTFWKNGLVTYNGGAKI